VLTATEDKRAPLSSKDVRSPSASSRSVISAARPTRSATRGSTKRRCTSNVNVLALPSEAAPLVMKRGKLRAAPPSLYELSGDKGGARAGKETWITFARTVEVLPTSTWIGSTRCRQSRRWRSSRKLKSSHPGG